MGGRASKGSLGKEAEAIMEVERTYAEQIQKIRKATRKDLDSPPGPPSEISGKQSDAGTFVTDLIQKYDVKNYIGTAYCLIISFQGLNVDSLKGGTVYLKKSLI